MGYCAQRPRAAPEIGGKDRGVASANNLAFKGEEGVGERQTGTWETVLASPGLHFHLCVPFLDETAGTDRGGEHLAKASANVDTKGRRTGRGIAKRLLRVMLPAGHLRLTRDSDPEWLRECASEPLVRRSRVGVGTQPAVSRVAGPRGCRATSRQHVFTTGPSHAHPHREPSGLQATTQGCKTGWGHFGGTASNEALRIRSTSSDNAGEEGTHGELSNSKPSFPTTFWQRMEVWLSQLANADIKPSQWQWASSFLSCNAPCCDLLTAQWSIKFVSSSSDR
jgi:hypothetical protein